MLFCDVACSFLPDDHWNNVGARTTFLWSLFHDCVMFVFFKNWELQVCALIDEALFVELTLSWTKYGNCSTLLTLCWYKFLLTCKQ